MKIDFYAPKKLFGAHACAVSGWIVAMLYNYNAPMNQTSYGCGLEVVILPVFYVWFLMVIAIFFTVDKYTKKRVTKPFFLHNIIYDVFFDIGIVLMLVPFFWFGPDCVITIKNLIPIFVFFVCIRIMKLYQRFQEKKTSKISPDERIIPDSREP